MKSTETVTPPTSPNATPATAKPSRRLLLPLLGLAIVLAGALGVWLIIRQRPPQMHGTVLQSPEVSANFTLTATDGSPLSLSDLSGKWTALYFGYSFCPDVCPTTLSDLTAATDALGKKAEELNVVFVSLDPARDTPERMGQYLAYFNPAFIGLTGDPKAINAVATQFGVFYEVHEAEGASGYLVDHTSTVIVLDPEGRIRIVFPYGTSGADMAADLAWFMQRG